MNLATLNALPSAVWAIAGSVITGCMSLIGIYLTNSAHTTRQETERKMALRREVYLGAVEAVSALQSYFGELINLSKPLPSGEIATHIAALSKVYLIGGEETVRALLAFVNRFLAAYAKIALQRTTLSARQSQLAPLESAREWIAFARTFKDDCFAIAKLTGPGILALRRELGLPIDEAMMRSLMDAGLQENIAVLDNFIGQMEKLVENEA
jgi:hypothetical protein